MNEKIWRTLIVDDERLARQKLRSMLAVFPTLQIVGEADSVKEALAQIKTLKPELIFLDVQMPGESGFQLLERTGIDAKIVFVTAYDQFAVRAFEVNALDYLLKPVNKERLVQTVARLQASSAESPQVEKLNQGDFIFASTRRGARFIKVSSIVCVLAANVYSEVLTVIDGKYLFLKSLNDWESRLPSSTFLRIHRSTIINLDFIERVEKTFTRSLRVYLRGVKEPFAISRRYEVRVREKFS